MLNPLWKKEMMEEFETGIKRSFGDGDEVYLVHLKGIEDDPKNNIIDGTIQIRPYVIPFHSHYVNSNISSNRLPRNILRDIFNPIYLQIQDLVKKQTLEAQDRGYVVNVCRFSEYRLPIAKIR